MALSQLWPSHELVIDTAVFDSVDAIISRFRAANADELVLVAPWTLIRRLIKHGVKPIYAQMQQIPCRRADVEVTLGSPKRPRCYRFVQFMRCENVSLQLTTIQPQPEKET